MGGGNTFTNNSGSVTVRSSLLEATATGYIDGGNNLTTAVSPFVSQTDARLNACAPAINTGSNEAYSAAGGPPTDLAANPRIYSGTLIDRGAYEYHAAPTITLTAPSLSTATTGAAFSQSFTASGGSSPYSYSVASGSLPTGLGLATTGVLSGTPTQAGSFTITVLGRDATGCSGVSRAYVLTVGESPIRYVRAGGVGNGSSWADASGDLQSQINLGGAQQVWVAQGTYKPGGNANTNRSLSFALKNGVSVLGGFAPGGSPTLSERNPGSFTSVLSGDIGTLGSNADNTYHVIENKANIDKINNTAVLDGFIIRDGNDNDGDEGTGGGMLNGASSPSLVNCSFVSNSATESGGGMRNFNGSSPSLVNCSFVSNSAPEGGGMFNSSGSNPNLINCSFVSNSAATGGGMFNTDNSSPSLTNCVVFGNGGATTFGAVREGIITIRYSLLESTVTGYIDGGNNLTTTTSPFASQTDARLNACAPAINTGSNAAYSAAGGPPTDLAANPRIYPTGGVIDMGAYEYQAAPNPAPTVINPSLSTATVGVAFSQNFTASGGSSPYSYSIASGSLPTGLSLATTGTLSGIPTQTGSFTITVLGRDANGCLGVSGAYVLTVGSASPIRYVRAGGVGSGNSWADASGDLQSQINLAGAQQVWVAQGTYKPGSVGNTNRTLSFAMKNGVSVLGGFAPSGSPTLGERNPGSFTTVLSGDLGTPGSNADNAYHVVSNTNVDNTAVMDGVVIRDGHANGGGDTGAGGGLFNTDSSPRLLNCSLVNNSATGAGGGLFNRNNSNPSLVNCSFLGNSAQGGGGMCNFNNSSPSLVNCSFVGNSANQGGGLFNNGSSAGLTNCVVFGTGGANTFRNISGGTVTVRSSLLEASVTGYTDGGNNLTTTVSPFVSASDLSLNACAPALNTGDNAAYNAANGGMPPTTDGAGNPRIVGTLIDMGAVEFQGAPTTITLTAPSVSTAAQGVSFTQSFTATGGSGPYRFSLSSGSLPPGLSLSGEGVLSGRPTQAGVFPLGVVASDANGCSGAPTSYTLTVLAVADLTPLLYTRPTTVNGTQPITVVVDVVELNGVVSSGPITLRISKDARLSLSLDGSLTTVNGRPVQNSVWSLTGPSGGFYTLSSPAVIAGGGTLSVGLTGVLDPSATTGSLSVSSVIVGGSGGEVRSSNNSDADKIEYFPQ